MQCAATPRSLVDAYSNACCFNTTGYQVSRNSLLRSWTHPMICTTLQSFCCWPEHSEGRFLLLCIATMGLPACCSRDLQCIQDAYAKTMLDLHACVQSSNVHFVTFQRVLKHCFGFHWQILRMVCYICAELSADCIAALHGQQPCKCRLFCTNAGWTKC